MRRFGWPESKGNKGNKGNAGKGTTRYRIKFSQTKDGKTEICERAWRAPTAKEAVRRLLRVHSKGGIVCKELSVTRIPDSDK
jgi:hypothetical protein